MKRGIDDEKNMGPMFPRLHVNDKEKGGPRAPPRNKMALYEQLSIPSQRFNPGRLPLKPNNTANLASPASSSQGSVQEQSVFLPFHLPPSIPSQSEKLHTPQFDTINTISPSAKLEQRKKVGDDDDFRVPIFVNSEIGQCHRNNQSNVDRGNLTPFSPTYSGGSTKIQSSSKKLSSAVPLLEQNVGSHNEINLKEHSVKSISLLTRGKIDGHVKQANVSTHQENGNHPALKHDRLHGTDACMRKEYRVGPQLEDTGHDAEVLDDHTSDMENRNTSRKRSVYNLVVGLSSPQEPNVYGEYPGDKTCGSLQAVIADRNDDASETSMVDSISGLDISPDDVVGIIGQKHFWKARRAIVNQQRVFAVQVFELHRLIKVQKLMAGTPHLLIEDGAYLGKASVKVSPAKKLSVEYVIKPPQHIVKHKDDLEKPNQKMEYSAENAVGKTSVSSVKNGSQPSTYGTYSNNPTSAPLATDTKMAPWCFPQPPGHQWLVPVMSPSEGLIYKPYPGPGFMGAVTGGGGPMGPTGNFGNSAYGIPPHHHNHQGVGVLPAAPPVGHGYFPPYGMPVMNPAISGSAVEQMSMFAGPGSYGQAGQLSGGGANFSMQRQSSCSLPSQKSRAVSQVVKIPASRYSELQGSTASSPSERVQQREAAHNSEERDALPLFPTTPAALPDGANSQPHDNEQPTRVIRVVPHNPRSATESAARIFQSIQEERKQFDSI